MRSATPGTHVMQLSTFSVDGGKFLLECYDNLDSIKTLETDWRRLETSCQEDFTFYQTYNWCVEYYKRFANDLSDKHCPIPQVFVLRSGQFGIMIWPMMLIQSRTGLKILTTATEPLGQYCNLLLDGSVFDETIGHEVLNLILKHTSADSVSFNNYPEGCLIDKIIGEQGIREKSNLESSVLDMSQYENWEAYTQTLSKGAAQGTQKKQEQIRISG